VEETNGMTMLPQSHMQKLLSVDVAHLRDLLESLSIRHRVARSLGFLGTALKVVAGTPDAEDFEKIKLNEFQFFNANNRQISINNKVQDQINNISATVNQLLRSAKGAQIDSGHLYDMLLSRNGMLTMELQNLLLAIALAKVNIVSPSILDHADLEGMYVDEGAHRYSHQRHIVRCVRENILTYCILLLNSLKSNWRVLKSLISPCHITTRCSG